MNILLNETNITQKFEYNRGWSGDSKSDYREKRRQKIPRRDSYNEYI